MLVFEAEPDPHRRAARGRLERVLEELEAGVIEAHRVRDRSGACVDLPAQHHPDVRRDGVVAGLAKCGELVPP